MATLIPVSASPDVARSPAALPPVGGAILREPVALIGLLMVLTYVGIALVVEWLPVRDPLQISTHRLAAPSAEFPFGTDALGRDLLSRILFGARLTTAMAMITFVGSGPNAATIPTSCPT